MRTNQIIGDECLEQEMRFSVKLAIFIHYSNNSFEVLKNNAHISYTRRIMQAYAYFWQYHNDMWLTRPKREVIFLSNVALGGCRLLQNINIGCIRRKQTAEWGVLRCTIDSFYQILAISTATMRKKIEKKQRVKLVSVAATKKIYQAGKSPTTLTTHDSHTFLRKISFDSLYSSAGKKDRRQ